MSIAVWDGPGCRFAGGILLPDAGEQMLGEEQMLGTAGGIQQDGLDEGVRERRDDTPEGLGREVGANCPDTLTFLNSPVCDFVVLMSSHVAQCGCEFASNSVNNKCDIFTVFTGDPHELILGRAISQTV